MSDPFIDKPDTLYNVMRDRLREWWTCNAIDDGAGSTYVDTRDLAETVDAQVTYLLTAVRAQLLSPEAVEAALDGEKRWSCGGQDMTRMHPTNRARRMVESALDAAGITEGSDDDH